MHLSCAGVVGYAGLPRRSRFPGVRALRLRSLYACGRPATEPSASHPRAQPDSPEFSGDFENGFDSTGNPGSSGSCNPPASSCCRRRLPPGRLQNSCDRFRFSRRPDLSQRDKVGDDLSSLFADQQKSIQVADRALFKDLLKTGRISATLQNSEAGARWLARRFKAPVVFVGQQN